MRPSTLLALTSLAAAGCSVEGGDRQAAAAEQDPGTTIRIAGDGAQVEARGAGIRVGRNGIEVDLDRDIELNVGRLRARIRPGNDGAAAIAANSE